MATVPITKISKLQENTDNIRNVCVLAHVDHGKTTLTDSLLSTNGIISSRLAGKVRYLDSRKDEQERGITMESSGISLYYKASKNVPKPSADPTNDQKSENNTPQTNSLVESEYLINLIDSPGHIDFGSEVSSAARLSDGALVLVDVVEGVCTQTINVLRQAWIEKVSSILVINKIDRLISHLKMTPNEAYIHIQHLIQQVNAVLAGFWESDRIEESDKRVFENNNGASADIDNSSTTNKFGNLKISTENWHLEEKDDSHIYYSPEKSNVIFASAYDGWAFRLNEFATLFAEKMGIGSPQKLLNFLWGDYYIDPKNRKRILTKKQMAKLYGDSSVSNTSNYQPLFVQLCLNSIWKVYETIIESNDQDKIDKIIQTIGAKISTFDRKTKDSKQLLTIIMRSWLPIAHTSLLAIIDLLPSPKAAQKLRVPVLLKGKSNYNSGPIVDSILNCSNDPEIASVAYISKMIAVKKSDLAEFNRKSDRLKLTAEEMRARGRPAPLTRTPKAESPQLSSAAAPGALNPSSSDLANNSAIQQSSSANPQNDSTNPSQPLSPQSTADIADKDEYLVGFARLYCGTLKVGQKATILNPSYKPKKPNSKHLSSVEIAGLYILMGSELLPTTCVYPGCIFGIRGKDDLSIFSGTLTTNLENCPNLTIIHSQSAPIVRVAIEPTNPSDITKLSIGLSLLQKSDSCVKVDHSSTTGEYVLITAGELHLERCLKDLIERFAKCELQVSEPQVPFRETIVRAPGNPNAFTTLYGPGYVTSAITNAKNIANSGFNSGSNSNVNLNSMNTGSNSDNNPGLKSILNNSTTSHLLGSPKPGNSDAFNNGSTALFENESSVSEERGYISVFTPNKLARISLTVEPLPDKLPEFLIKNRRYVRSSYIKSSSNTMSNSKKIDSNNDIATIISTGDGNDNNVPILKSYDDESDSSDDDDLDVNGGSHRLVDSESETDESDINLRDSGNNDSSEGPKHGRNDNIQAKIQRYFKKDKHWEPRSRNMNQDNLWSFGPHHTGPNILIKTAYSSITMENSNYHLLSNNTYDSSKTSTPILNSETENSSEFAKEQTSKSTSFKDIEQAIQSGFQLATRSGPLCAEPLVGLGVTIHNVSIQSGSDSNSLSKLQFSMLVGQLISTVRDAIREAMLSWSPRLLLAMYDCQINIQSEMLGKMYGVIGKLHGKITNEEMREGTPYFFVTATIPVVESFGFADEVRKRTSGSAQPLLVYRGFEMLDTDPFWVPSTLEELEDLGEIADRENLAKLYMDKVRTRKGLFVEKKIVERAEKQRTLKK
ncbi:Ribosome assembly protein 1 [Smittium culicis]|uniref:Elongation factor 2 n=1 Tax=Smittium culicis TaxID=133412 RepID=A0A1R1Y855_9FUNG|nr:Ribosome assembly protein 1 [Smittium culicis]